MCNPRRKFVHSHSFLGGQNRLVMGGGGIAGAALAGRASGLGPSFRRDMSTSADGGAGSADAWPSFSDSMSKILPGVGSSPIPPEGGDDSVASAVVDAASSVPFEATWWPTDQALVLLNYVHVTTGMPFALTIGATTLSFRVLLFPLFLKAQRNSARMAHMQPEFLVLKEQIEKLGKNPDAVTQQKYMNQTRALFKKYDCNPMGSLVAPVFSAPIFISMFLSLKKAPEHFPDVLSNGGFLWFTDLTQADPYCIMPLISAGMFLGMTELGKGQMMASNPAQGKIMINAFRALAIVMVPLTMNFNAAVFCYWTVNNAFSVGQSFLFQNKVAKKAMGIWDTPKPTPGKEAKNIFDEIKTAFAKKEEEMNATADERVKAHNEIVERQKIVKQSLMEKDRSQKRRGRK